MPNHVINKLHFDCSDEQREAILAAVQYDPDPEHEETTGVGTFDFHKIIPMPNSLNIVAGSETDSAIAIYLSAVNPKTTLAIGEDKLDPTDFSDLVARLNAEKWYSSYRTDMSPDDVQEACGSKSAEDMLALGRTAVTNMLEYGATTWYDWCINNWGTKWNSYDPNKDFSDGLSFSTAWSAPEPVIRMLSERYPDVAITHEWADEDIGRNCGRREYIGGECISEYFPESDAEAIEFAVETWGDEPEDYGLVRNAADTGYVYMSDESYELVELFDKPALFTNERLSTSDIPEGMYVYHLRGSDEDPGCFATLEEKVGVNHAGSIVTMEPIDFGEQGYIAFFDDTEPNFIGSHISFEQYRDGDYSIEPQAGQTDGIS